jgi:hypothetical protein
MIEKIVDELLSWELYEENWDGEGAVKPCKHSISLAIEFLKAMPQTIVYPEPMLNANGHAGLFWDIENFYADIEFYEDDRITYFIKHSDKDQYRGVVNGSDFSQLFILLTEK